MTIRQHSALPSPPLLLPSSIATAPARLADEGGNNMYFNNWECVHPTVILAVIPHRAQRRAFTLLFCGEFPMARIDANWFCRGPPSIIREKKLLTLHPPHPAPRCNGHRRAYVILFCTLVLSRRDKFLEGFGEDAILHTGSPESNFRYILTSHDPSVWRRSPGC